MIIVRDFLSFFVMVFNVVVKASTVESKIRFVMIRVRMVKGLPSWSKTDNSSKIKNSRSDHTTWYLENISLRLLKTYDNYKDVRVIPRSKFG